MKFYKKVSIVGISMLWIGANLVAQNVADSLHQLPEVVVTEKYDDREIRSSAPLQILTKQTLQNLNVLQVSDAVKFFSGVNVKDYGGIGGLKTVSVRSLGAAHTSVSYNGIPLSDAQTGQIDIGKFSLDNVEALTLSLGQNDQIFMPARLFASASALDIRTTVPSFENNRQFSGKASLKGGSFGLFNPSFYLAKQFSNRLVGTINGEWLSANGKYPYLLRYGNVKGDSTSWEERKNTDVQNLRLEGALFGKISEKSSADIRLYYYQSDRGLPGATIFYNTNGFSKQRLDENTFFVQAHYENALSQLWSIQANAKYNRGYVHYLDPTYLGSEGKLENKYTQKEQYGSLAALYKAFQHLSFSASSDLTRQTLDANLYNFAYPTRLTWQSVVAAKYVSDRILATSSLLFTQTFESVKVGNPADNRNRWSPYIGISVKPFENHDLRLRAFYKNIFRMPTFNDLYYTAIGKRSLKPEDTDQFNLGATYSTSFGTIIPLLTLTADGFRNNVRNKIVAYPVKNVFEWSMMNYGKVEISGLDLSLETIVRFSEKIGLLAGSNFTYQKALNMTDPKSSAYKHQLPYTPRHSGGAHATLQTTLLDLSYSLLWSGIQYAGAQNVKQNEVSGYTDHSISISKEKKIGFGTMRLSVEALNIGNKNYEIVRYFPMPGRSFRGTLSINF